MAIEQKRMTYEEFEAFADAPENSDRLFELIDGEIIEVSPNKTHGRIALRIGASIFNYLEAHPIGEADVEVRHKMPDDDYNAVQPDVAFTSVERDDPNTRTGAVPYMPDLAVEIKSPNDTNVGLRKKAAYYLDNGALMVWLVNPDKRIIEIYQPDADIQVLTLEDTIDGGDVLPGFTLAVRDVFNV